MTGNAASFHQNFVSEKKPSDIVEKDIRKWVESVVEFKANLDKQKGEQQLEKHLKKIKKFKIKNKPSLVTVPTKNSKKPTSGQHKNAKTKRVVKKTSQQPPVEKPIRKDQPQVVDLFDSIKESYRNLKLPQNWTSGLSGNRVVFNRVKVTTLNAQQKMVVERSLVITKDRNVHILINGSEIPLNNWEMQKVETMDDIKRAIKDIDSLRVCDGPSGGVKSPQCSMLLDSKVKVCQACKSETSNPPKTTPKKPRTTKKTGGIKGVPKQKSFQT